jgi:CRISPR-associated exonuclease Cas4
MYSEDDFLPISALQHLVFCERQWALIHLEQLWSENILTAQGNIMHKKVHEMEHELRSNTIIAMGLPLRSFSLGLIGKADVVEFVAICDGNERNGVELDGYAGYWKPMPVEYKRGKPKEDHSDEIQLCAQAMCLEEMFGIEINEGALFYCRPHRRSRVRFDNMLRSKTTEVAKQLHSMTQIKKTPYKTFSKKCLSCSLYNYCMPKSAGKGKNVSLYIRQLIQNVEGGDDNI